MKEELIKSIENQTVITFDYDGGSRTVEPHCYGLTLAGNEGLRAYQIAGYSSSGKIPDWKMFDMSKASNIVLTEEIFNGPRERYERGDKGMSQIFIEL